MPTKQYPVDIASVRPALAEIERAIQWTYHSFSGDRTEGLPVTVVLQTRGKRATRCGYFQAEQWSTREGDDTHELSISTEFLNSEVVLIIATAVHETVHLYCNDAGIKDTSTGGRHNRKFRDAAQLFQLECADPYDSVGYGSTSPSPELCEAIEKEFKPDHAAFALFRKPDVPRESTNKTVAWICGCLKPTIRLAAKQELDATCHICDTKFARKETE